MHIFQPHGIKIKGCNQHIMLISLDQATIFKTSISKPGQARFSDQHFYCCCNLVTCKENTLGNKNQLKMMPHQDDHHHQRLDIRQNIAQHVLLPSC